MTDTSIVPTSPLQTSNPDSGDSLPSNFLYKEGIRHFPSANSSC